MVSAALPLDASVAVSAAEAASAATAAVLRSRGGDATAEALAQSLVAADKHELSEWDRVAVVHRLNEHFAACGSYEAAEALAGKVVAKAPGLGTALVALMTDCDALIELAAQLMHSLCLHTDGGAMLAKAGALSVLAAALRADEPLLRAHGLALLATLSERPEMAKPLTKAGVLKLVCFLAKNALPTGTSGKAAGGGSAWPPLLEIAEALLRTPSAVPTVQRQQLRDVLAQAAFAHKAGHLPLEIHDGRRLTRLLITLRALALADPPAGQRTKPKS